MISILQNILVFPAITLFMNHESCDCKAGNTCLPPIFLRLIRCCYLRANCEEWFAGENEIIIKNVKTQAGMYIVPTILQACIFKKIRPFGPACLWPMAGQCHKSAKQFFPKANVSGLPPILVNLASIERAHFSSIHVCTTRKGIYLWHAWQQQWALQNYLVQ